MPVAWLLCVSVAEQCTVVVPSGNEEPEDGEQSTATVPSTRSLADAENVTAVPNGTVMSEGRDSVGGVVSWTVTVNVAGVGVVFPEASVAVHCTLVLPSAKVLPEGWSQLIDGDGSALSVAAIV